MSTINTDTNYRDWLSTQTGTTDKTKNVNGKFDAVFVEEEDTSLSFDDFLNLMVAQLKNQDFMNPVDNTQYISQMAQFANLQEMQKLSEYSKTNYVMSLVGKNVTAAKYSVSGKLDKATGMVTKVSLVDSEYKIFIGDKSFSLSQIMEINQTPNTDNTPPNQDKEKEKVPMESLTPASHIETPSATTDPNVKDQNPDAAKETSEQAGDSPESDTNPNAAQTVTDSAAESPNSPENTSISNPDETGNA